MDSFYNFVLTDFAYIEPNRYAADRFIDTVDYVSVYHFNILCVLRPRCGVEVLEVLTLAQPP